jgi:septum formation protein
MRRIVLASTSPYRRQLLARLNLPFDCAAPSVDEAALPGEAPAATALRLSEAKAIDVATRHPDAIVIGADQVADLDGVALNKPGSHAAALAQLMLLQGRQAVFHSGLALAVGGGLAESCVVPTTVRFRTLPAARLDAYLRHDQPYDCAGSAKVESLGIVLLEWVRSDDPSALIGLPLIRLTSMLAHMGITLPMERPQ